MPPPGLGRLSLVDLPTSTNVVCGDRRGCPRYQYDGEVQFEMQSGEGAKRIGHGVLADVSRRGLRFRAEAALEPGAELVMHIAWPALLQNVCALELVVRGLVTRVSERGTVVSIRDYEFRTCGERSFWEAPAPSSNWRVA